MFQCSLSDEIKLQNRSLDHASATLLTSLQNLEEGRANHQEQKDAQVEGTHRHLVFFALSEGFGHFKAVHFPVQILVELAIAHLQAPVLPGLFRPPLRIMHIDVVVLMGFRPLVGALIVVALGW